MAKKPVPSQRNSKSASKGKQLSLVQRISRYRYAKPALFVVAFMLIGVSSIFMASAATTTYSLWSSSAVPQTLASSDSGDTEVGVKFKSSVAGYVTGVRFYKSAQNTGTHTGNLWDTNGQLLASVQFTGETSSGWQTATFSKPVSIAASVPYTISYRAPQGHYSLNTKYFTSRAYTNRKLTALRSTSAHANGVFAHGSSTATFPTQSGNGTNYWVDVVFNTKLLSADPAPAAPAGVTASLQADGSVAINWQASVSANPITEYTVYRNGSKLGSAGTSSHYTDGSTQAGNTYDYQVQATDSLSKTSVLSNTATVTIPSSTGGTTPPPPTTAGCIGTAQHVSGGPDGTGTCWPGASNTGVPAGTTLTTYSGPCVVTTDNTVIDSKLVNCSPLEIQAKAVVVKNSKVNGQIYINSDNPVTSYNLNWSLVLQDSEVAAPQVEEPAVFEGAMTIVRSNIHGGITSVQCGDKAAQCIIQDSWLHGQLMPANVDWHLGGFHSIGGTNYTMTHNTVVCDTPVNNVGGGCSGDIVFIPYDKNISHALVQHNLLGANQYGSYCTYAGDKPGYTGTYMVYKDNVFQRGTNNLCGAYGPVDGFGASNIGNQWVNNTWADGPPVSPN
jgi:hypothetical protein